MMEYDEEKVEEVTLAMMYLSLGDDGRAWKGYDWDTLDRLFARGLIADPKNKNKSVALTEQGVRECERLFRKHFAK